MMKVLHINTLDSGGAANACMRIHQSLKLVGIESKVLVLHKSGEDDDVYSFRNFIDAHKKVHYVSRLNKVWRTGKINRFYKSHQQSGFFSLVDSYYDVTNHPLMAWADVVHLHWIGNFLDYPSFFQKVKKPVVWTCHDMNPMTGGCHYFGACEQYQSDCRVCPLLEPSFKKLASSSFTLKENLLGNMPDLHFVANSSWVAQTLAQSRITKNCQKSIIHYPIFSDDYYVTDKLQARKQLGLVEKKIVLFVAQYVGAENKGFRFLSEAIHMLNSEQTDLMLLVVGKGTETDFEGISNYRHYHYLDSASSLRAVYNAADVFVIPSIDEAFGQTCLEAMACGLPVVGFDSGGIPDMVEDGRNGLLVRRKDVQGLSEAIDCILQNKVMAERMGNRSLELIAQNFSPVKQAGKYRAVYEQLLLQAGMMAEKNAGYIQQCRTMLKML